MLYFGRAFIIIYCLMRTTSLLLLTCYALSACIQEFVPQDVKEERGLVVIDGTIREGESVFSLSRTIGISDTLTGAESINDASVFVELNDGTRIPALFTGDGKYAAQIPSLDMQKEYRLSALIEGETYESGYLSPMQSVPIDSIFPIKKGQGEPVSICVATADPTNASHYYRWSYRETWEVKAELYATARKGPNGSVIFHNLTTSENTYCCWGRDFSHTILLATSEKLSENKIPQQELVSIPAVHDKLSVLYHIEVEQMQIRDEAYAYFSDVMKAADFVGDLFSPVLTSGLRGNIHCLNDPGRLVIGYIEVGGVSRADRYVWESEGFYEPPVQTCYDAVFSGTASGFAYYTYDPMFSVRYECVDCLMKEKASKDRPTDWPIADY